MRDPFSVIVDHLFDHDRGNRAPIKLRETAFGAAILLAMFGLAMAISQGVKSPLDYSVFSASAAALLLGRAVMKP
jgi:hypothetical protein